MHQIQEVPSSVSLKHRAHPSPPPPPLPKWRPLRQGPASPLGSFGGTLSASSKTDSSRPRYGQQHKPLPQVRELNPGSKPEMGPRQLPV